MVGDVATEKVQHRIPITPAAYGTRPFDVTSDGTEVVAFGPADPRTAICKVVVWSLETGKKVRTLCDCGYGSELAVTPDGKRFLTSDQPGRKVVMGDVATGKVVGVWNGWRGTGITVSPDGNSFVAEGMDLSADKPFSGFMRVRIDHLK